MILLTEIEESEACPNPVGARGNRELFISLEITLRFFSKSFLGNRGQRSEGRGFPAEFADLKSRFPQIFMKVRTFPSSLSNFLYTFPAEFANLKADFRRSFL